VSLHSGRIAAGELGAVVLIVDHGPVGCSVAATLFALAFGRWRGRWLSARLSTVVGYVARPRGTALGPPHGAVLELADDGREVALPPLTELCPPGALVRLVVSVAPADRRVLLGIRPAGAVTRLARALDRAGIRYRQVDPGTGHPTRVEERWSGLVVDGLHTACFRTPPGDPGPPLGLPARATVGLDGDGTVVRLAAGSRDGLTAAADALRRAVPDAVRMDGEHRTGLAATVPVPPWDASTLDRAVTVPAGGLVVGWDRHGRPVTVRLGRGVLVGGAHLAHLLAARAGPHVTVHPDRLVGVDLLIRDRLTAADRDLLTRADVVILSQLDEAGAALAGEALGLGTHAEWLTRLGTGLVGVVAGRSVRWARLDEAATRVPAG
jgi:hypothetical protein